MKQITLLILAMLSSVLILPGCRQSPPREEGPGSPGPTGPPSVTLSLDMQREVGLTLAPVDSAFLRRSLTIPVRLTANQDLEAYVGSLLQGRVHQVSANLGDHVRKGQVLLQIEGLEVGEVKARFIKARAELTFAEANFKRQQSLAEQKIGSGKTLLEAQANYEKALAEFNAEDKKIHSIGLTDNDVTGMMRATPGETASHQSAILSIRSPLDGVVVERSVVTGQLVDVNTNAFHIMNTSSLWAEGEVHEKDSPWLTGKPVVALNFPAYAGESFPGQIIYAGVTVDRETRMVKVRALVPNAFHRLKPEMYGEMRLPVRSGPPCLSVPAASLVKEGERSFVFVARTDTTFEKREVNAGSSTETAAEILRGVRRGERVVVNGAFLLKAETLKDSMAGGD